MADTGILWQLTLESIVGLSRQNPPTLRRRKGTLTFCKVSPDWPAGDLVISSLQAWSAFKLNRSLQKVSKAMQLKYRNHRFQNTTALYHHSQTQPYLIAISSRIPRSSKPIYKPSVTSLPVVKVSGGARSCLEWNFLTALMNQVPDPRDQPSTISDQATLKKKKNTFRKAGRDAWMMKLS